MAETKTVHFHVGSGRCGSTLLQVILNLPAVHEMLKTFGYKSDLAIYINSGPLTYHGMQKFVEAEWREFRHQHFLPFRTEPYRHLIATQENFFGVNHEPGSVNTCEEACKLVSYLTETCLVRIVIVLRRQDTFIESLYNQLLKTGETRPFEQYLDEFPLDNLKWDTVVDTYANHFGADNVTVIPFEKPVVKTAKFTSFVSAFFSAIGIPVPVSFGEEMRVINASLAPRTMEVQRVANMHLSAKEAHGLANWFVENINKRPDERYSLIGDEKRKELLAYYRTSNENLAAKYLSKYDAGYYIADPEAA